MTMGEKRCRPLPILFVLSAVMVSCNMLGMETKEDKGNAPIFTLISSWPKGFEPGPGKYPPAGQPGDILSLVFTVDDADLDIIAFVVTFMDNTETRIPLALQTLEQQEYNIDFTLSENQSKCLLVIDSKGNRSNEVYVGPGR
jgi:hypothetical protein